MISNIISPSFRRVMGRLISQWNKKNVKIASMHGFLDWRIQKCVRDVNPIIIMMTNKETQISEQEIADINLYGILCGKPKAIKIEQEIRELLEE